MSPNSYPPGQYSSTKYSLRLRWKVAWSLTIKGWWHCICFIEWVLALIVKCKRGIDAVLGFTMVICVS
jgi:hypothetical protein